MNIIANTQKISRWNSNISRMNRIAKSILYYNNILSSYLLDAIKVQHPKGYPLLSTFLRKFPLTLRLIDDMSIVFLNGFTYNYNGNDKLILILSDYIKNSNLYHIMITVNRLVNLVYDVGLLVTFNNDSLYLDILTPDRCIVKQNEYNPTKIDLLYYLVNTYTDTVTFNKINVMKKITNETISDVLFGITGLITKQYNVLPNPYGYIPVVWFHADNNIDTFWSEKHNPLIDMHTYYSLGKTYLSLAIAYQSIATLITKGLPLTSVLSFGPQFWIDLPKTMASMGDTSDAKYLTPQANFTAMADYNDSIETQAAQYANLSADAYKKSATYSSGYQMLLSKTDIIKYNKLQLSMFNKGLQLLFSIILDTINIFSEYNLTNIIVTIDIPRPKIQYSPELLRALKLWKLKMGIISNIDVLREYYSDLTDYLLIEKYNNNIATVKPALAAPSLME